MYLRLEENKGKRTPEPNIAHRELRHKSTCTYICVHLSAAKSHEWRNIPAVLENIY